MSPTTFNHGLAKGRNAAAAITKKRFVVIDTTAADGETVKQAASATTAGEPLYGVSIFSVSSAEILKGKGASVVLEGRAIVTAAAALVVGARVTSDANGKAVAATTGDWLGGIVDEPAVNADDDCTVRLVCDGTKA